MREKKSEVMTIRITPGTRLAIENEARKREWTPSKMAEKILSSWAQQESQQESMSETRISFQQNSIQNIHIE